MHDPTLQATSKPIDAVYFDGKNAKAHAVTLCIDAHTLVIYGKGNGGANGVLQHYSLTACTLEAPLGKSVRRISLADGGLLEIAPTTDNVASLQQQWPAASGLQQGLQTALHNGLHWMEHHWLVITMALLGIIVSMVWAIQIGIPWLSERLATHLSPALERTLGEEVLQSLNQPALGYFVDSQLPVAQQQTIARELSAFCRLTHCPPYQLIFKASPALGANAIAIPGGTMIVTDALVNLAHSPSEVVAVLAHEIAHIKYHHGLRQVLQTSLSGLALLVLTGDVSHIVAGLPTLLINMQYSRAFETEADNDALVQLRKACIPPHYFALMLERLAATQKEGAMLPELLASHPDTHKRSQPFLKAEAACQRL